MPIPFFRRRKLSNEHLFRRVSQITGISEKDLRPAGTRRMGKQSLIVQGGYDPWSHELVVNPAFKGKGISNHEERHALQNIVMPWTLERKYISRREARGDFSKAKNKMERTIDRQKRTNRTFRELTNPVQGGPELTGMNASGYSGMTRLGGVFAAQLLVHAKLGYAFPVVFAPEIVKSYQFQGIINRHGEDGALLLWANPPMKNKRVFATSFRAWEKRMIQEGLLHPKSGLTSAGETLIRERVTLAQTQKRLARFAAVRKAREERDSKKRERRKP